jgi:Caspase domain
LPPHVLCVNCWDLTVLAKINSPPVSRCICAIVRCGGTRKLPLSSRTQATSLERNTPIYRALIEQDIDQIDFALLYAAGVRLANAEKASSDDSDLPSLSAPVRETVDSLLQLHGTFILASAEGLQALAAEERYHRTSQEETEYRAAAVEFAEKLQKHPEIVDPKVATAVLEAAEEIGKGVNPERSSTVATGMMRNVTITVSIAATLGALTAGAIASGYMVVTAVTGAAVLVAAEGLKKSRPFAALSAAVTEGIDKASEGEVLESLRGIRDQFKFQLGFFFSAEPALRRLAGRRDEFTWLANASQWLKRQVGMEAAVARPPSDVAPPPPASDRSSLPMTHEPQSTSSHPGPAAPYNRLALVIGISRYPKLANDQQLRKTVNDARSITLALEDLGFEVYDGIDLDRASMIHQISDFEARIGRGDTVLFFFSGHGVTINGENFLLSADVPSPRDGQQSLLRDLAYSVTVLVERFQTKAGLLVTVLDACRGHPFERSGTGSLRLGHGLAPMHVVPRNTFILHSAADGQESLDRLSEEDTDENSVFTRVLLKYLRQRNLSLTDLVQRVRKDVYDLASKVGHEQRPAYYDEVIDSHNVFLAGSDGNAA